MLADSRSVRRKPNCLRFELFFRLQDSRIFMYYSNGALCPNQRSGVSTKLSASLGGEADTPVNFG